MFEYSTGLYANEIAFQLPLSDKATVRFGFIGLFTTDPSTVRASGAANAKAPVNIEAFGTTSDIARLRAEDVDESGLTTDFKSLTLTIKNNVTAEKVLGKLGAKYVNAGNLEASVESELIFSNAAVIERIRTNKSVGLDTVLANNEGGFCLDLVAATIGQGKRNIKTNESVTITTTFDAYQDERFGISFAISLFPFLPDIESL